MNYDKRISVGTAQPVYKGTLTIAYGSTERRATGGGWVADTESANQKGNFGFTVSYANNGARQRALHIPRHRRFQLPRQE
jgi:hypothetical protein